MLILFKEVLQEAIDASTQGPGYCTPLVSISLTRMEMRKGRGGADTQELWVFITYFMHLFEFLGASQPDGCGADN